MMAIAASRHRATQASPEAPAGLRHSVSVPIARRKRNWRGQFVKQLRATPPESREWLIWSHYHRAWHRRSEEGGACGYTCDIAEAGIFIRSKADDYNDGDRNEAFHVSEKLDLIRAAIDRHEAALAKLRFACGALVELSA